MHYCPAGRFGEFSPWIRWPRKQPTDDGFNTHIYTYIYIYIPAATLPSSLTNTVTILALLVARQAVPHFRFCYLAFAGGVWTGRCRQAAAPTCTFTPSSDLTHGRT